MSWGQQPTRKLLHTFGSENFNVYRLVSPGSDESRKVPREKWKENGEMNTYIDYNQSSINLPFLDVPISWSNIARI